MFYFLFLLNGKSVAGSDAPAAVPVTLDRHTRGLLRYVKINEKSLTQTIQRLGGGERGLQVLLYHITLWAKQQNGAGASDANSIAKGLHYLSKLNDNERDTEENCAVPANHVINSPAPRSNNSNANTSEHPYHPITGLYCLFFLHVPFSFFIYFMAKKQRRLLLPEAESGATL